MGLFPSAYVRQVTDESPGNTLDSQNEASAATLDPADKPIERSSSLKEPEEDSPFTFRMASFNFVEKCYILN